MQLKILSIRTLLVVTLVELAIFLALLFHLIPKGPIQSDSALLVKNAVVLPKQEQVSYGLPVRLKIPVINVDSVIEDVGLTPQGAVGVPKDPTNTAWFNLGPRPGENGSAVIAGHYGRWEDGERSVFDDLNKLIEGDILYVEDEKGATTAFVVRKSRSYNQTADASDLFGPNDGKAHLNLITCEGTWDEVSKSYSKRLVVFADKE